MGEGGGGTGLVGDGLSILDVELRNHLCNASALLLQPAQRRRLCGTPAAEIRA